ncbi:chitin deacetylase 8-like [Rhynchophorus ferrugineus]|uniref:chitin deacetylase 8-like n=1 Tax=Rhynchophorus ferrugineus TaxID=354439 RepID=UPI003FCE17E3
MKFLTSFVLLCCIFACSHGEDAEQCEEDKCLIDSNCRCSSTNNPIDASTAPQLVVLAFVEAVTTELYDNRWSELLESRKNPDGSYIGATFYVPHEYTDYQKVQDIASIGFEVAVHSISNDAHQDYWRDANVTLLEQEFGGQRKIISKFANIDEKYITGVMTPQFQLAGDNSIKAFVQQGFAYDSSWPTKSPYFPYTFDYASTQSCDVGNSCPKESHPGFWEAPIIDLVSEDDVCATIAACFRQRNNQTKEEISDWLVQQVDTQRQANRAPVILIIESTWFDNVENSWDGLVDALDKLEALPDVYFVTQARVIEWLKNPVPLSEFETGLIEPALGCSPFTCKLSKPDGTIRYMNSCVQCPKSYPWLGNPEGN